MSTYTSTTMWGQITLGPNMEGSIAYIIWPRSHKRGLIWSSVRGPLWPQSQLIISISSVITSSEHDNKGYLKSATCLIISISISSVITSSWFRAVDIASYSQHRPCHQGFKIYIKHQSPTLGPIKINLKITFHVDLQWFDTTFIAFEWTNEIGQRMASHCRYRMKSNHKISHLDSRSICMDWVSGRCTWARLPVNFKENFAILSTVVLVA